MKKISFILLILAMAALGSCRGGSESGDEITSQELNGEEQRLENAQRIDTTLLSFVVSSDTLQAWEEAFDTLSADAWMLVEGSTGMVISSKNADERRYMASITKVMTCLLTLEHGHMDDSITITDDVLVTKDSRVRRGDKYLVGNLVREMMLQSDNDAAYALAKYVGGDTLTFYGMMNEKAAYIGMNGTHFANPNGMPNDNNYSTARDLVVLSRYCMADSAFAEIVGTAFMDIPLLDGRHLPSQNTNALLEKYDGCIGIKTGYTRQAGCCLASAAKRDDVTLFLVLLKSKSYTSRFTESAILLDHGFQMIDKCTARWK